VIKSRKQLDIRNLVDLDTPLCDHDACVCRKVDGLGMGPLEPTAKVKAPYDSLYVKLKRQRDSWNRN
jgi:hypothetical protein